ncbi:MAG: hypothetical protein LBT46_00185 [Planctomycetaceae bacterium]|jgi:predicted phage tail protein|nr:hypothetical protein [Planctomycetaceae bacterium]
MTHYEIIAVCISGIAAVISVVSLICSIRGQYINSRFSKATITQQIKTSVDAAKSQVEQMTVNMSSLIAKTQKTDDEQRQLEILKNAYDSTVEKVLNAYNDGCQKYFASLVLKDEFKRSYYSDIRQYVEEFNDKFTEPISAYTAMIRLYKEWHKP